MRRCSKCNRIISNNSKKCSKCGTSLSKEDKKSLEEQDIIKTPNKITSTESLENTIELKLKPIPLKVKPIKSPNSKKNKKSIFEMKLLSTIKIVLVLLLFLINTVLIYKVISNKEENQPIVDKPTTAKHNITNSIGRWRSSNNGLFSFEDDNKFFWYEYYDDLKNNYYSGTYNFKKGPDALEEMGYTEEEFNVTFGQDIKIENVYSMNLLPTYSFKAGVNMTEEDLSDNEAWWYILMIRNDGTAIAYNKTLDLRYNLVKN